ncbi:unnamed protein product [Leptidea sinapis]|uniref:Uncharacterized protein n=1 Tax=Leptidea sinapis TaxID=189913 RepID=A0A5E4QB69_9NEOP|nr:unnamed protein product [Leptidea sinapis]
MRTARSQPILCKFDAQCQSGFYCVPEVYVCMKLMKDLRGDVNSECVVGEARGPESLPYYVWVGIGAALLILALLVCFVSPCNRNGVTASAPELPPPYNAHYTPVRPSSPPPPEQDAQEDVSWGFVKRAPSTRVREARESAGSQAARVYNNPNYVRGPHLASNLPPRSLIWCWHTMRTPWRVRGLPPEITTCSATTTKLSSQLAAARTSTLLTTHCASQ